MTFENELLPVSQRERHRHQISKATMQKKQLIVWKDQLIRGNIL